MTSTGHGQDDATASGRDLANRINGRTITPEDEAYDQARAVWNAMIDRRPALIAECASADDVAACLAYARANDLPVTVRGAGHSVAGQSIADGALVIDLGRMNEVEVDAEARMVSVGAGAVGADLDSATQAVGLATTGGTDSTTGVVGLTLGGGLGFLGRALGTASDNLVGADVVLADGTRVHASETEHPDLFWALRGAGRHIGVVTRIELRLHEVGPQIAVAQAFYPFDAALDHLRAWRSFMSDAPDEVGSLALAVNVPPVNPFPADAHGTTALAVVASYAGSVEEGQRLLQPLCELGPSLLAGVQAMEYTVLQQSFDAANPAGMRYFWKSAYLGSLPDELLQTFVAHADPLPGPVSAAWFESLGGAYGRIDPSASVFPHRAAPFNLGISAGWESADDDDAAIAWARRFHEAMLPWATGGVYGNYIGLDDIGRPDAAFGPNLDRLRQIKDRYDPDGVFGRLGGTAARTGA